MADPTNTPEWPRTPDGRVRLFVTKTFFFVTKGANGQAEQRRFEGPPPTLSGAPPLPAEHLLDPEDPRDAAFLAHPWICQDFADGCVESPHQTRARLATEEAEAAARARRLAALQRETAMYTSRNTAALLSQGAAQHQSGGNLQDELNRPLNQLPPDVATQLDTPLNQLRGAA